MACPAPCRGVELLDQRTFLRHAEQWDTLLGNSYDNRVFLTADWFRIWCEHFSPERAAVMVHWGDDGTLQAALPLLVREREGARVLSLLGDFNVADYMDGLAERTDALELLTSVWTCALDDLRPDRVELRHVPSTSPLIPALMSAAERQSWQVGVEHDEVCPVALLCTSWDGYLEMLNKKQRHEVRRKLRRAQEDISWEWRTARSHEDVDRELPIFFRLHEASARDKSAFMTPGMRRYFGSLAHCMLDRDFLRLSVFQRDGIDIAATMGFVYRDRYFLYNSGYDPAYAVYSPGIVAAVHAMQDAIEEKCVAFDFLSGDEGYKYQLGATNTYTRRVTASPG